MTYSKLTRSYIPAHPNNYQKGRNGKSIRKMTPHHVAGRLTGEQIGGIFQNPSRFASSNYGIDVNGNIYCYVHEEDRAYTSSSPTNDNQAITVELANEEIGGVWRISDATIEAYINLSVDICQRYNINLVYSGDENGTHTLHRFFAATSCPGAYMVACMEDVTAEINKRLGNPVKAPAGNGQAKATNKHIYDINGVEKVNGIWQLRCDYLAPANFNYTDNGIALADIDFVDANGNLVDQTWNGNQTNFVFRENQITQLKPMTKGSGGWYWCQFKSDTAGTFWSSCNDLHDLLYRPN